jgi:hypothetical protein
LREGLANAESQIIGSRTRFTKATELVVIPDVRAKSTFRIPAPTTLVLWIVLSLITGCAHSKMPRITNQQETAVTVVPVRGQPIVMLHENVPAIVLGTLVAGFGGAVLANEVGQAATVKKRATLAERFNADISGFKPEVLLAEEFAKVLKASPKAGFRSVTVSSNSFDLPGRTELIRTETQPFKASWSQRMTWQRLALQWDKPGAVVNPVEFNPEDGKSLRAEVLLSLVLFINQKELQITSVAHIVDPTQGKVIDSKAHINRYKIAPVALDTDISIFLEDFRRCLNAQAQAMLKQLELL